MTPKPKPGSWIGTSRRPSGGWLPIAILAAAAVTTVGSKVHGAPQKPASRPIGVEYETGDRTEAMARELGTDDAETNLATVRVEGDSSFETRARVACRPEGQPGAHGSLRPFRVRLTHDEVGFEKDLDLILLLPEFHGAGEYEARATLTRTGAGGAVTESSGTAAVTIDRVAYSSIRHQVGGRLSARVEGEAGAATVEGAFSRCLYFD